MEYTRKPMKKKKGKPPQKMVIPLQNWIWEVEITCEFPFQHQSLWQQKFLKRRKHCLKLFAFIHQWILEMFSPAKVFGLTPGSPTLCWHLTHPFIWITPPLQLYPGYNVRNIYTDLEEIQSLVDLFITVHIFIINYIGRKVQHEVGQQWTPQLYKRALKSSSLLREKFPELLSESCILLKNRLKVEMFCL